MVSRRKLFSMLLMMAVLFFLYMLTQVYREAVNDYDTNEYATEVTLRRADAWGGETGTDGEQNDGGRETVLIGREDSPLGNVVAQWCLYAKRPLRCVASPKEYLARGDTSDAVLCIDPACLSLPEDQQLLKDLSEGDRVIIFGGLPETALLKESPELCRMLGIEEVRSEGTVLTGIHLYDGFLLGGEAFYRLNTEEEPVEEIERTMPWYRLGSGTKTYMDGLTGEIPEQDGVEDRLPLLWRSIQGQAKVFVVNGACLQDETGIGFLEGMLAESYSGYLYPMVNAQNLGVSDCPNFASERDEILEPLYASGQRLLLQNIIWPGLTALSEQSGFRMTYFMTPQFLYKDDTEADPDNLVYYLRQIKEQGGELGWSADSWDGIDMADKWSRDRAFFDAAESNYLCTAVCASEQETEELLAFAGEEAVKNVRTMVGEREDFLLSYLSEEITSQKITHRADRYTIADDLRNRSLQTALAYTNIFLDLENVFRPQQEADRWENYFRIAAGNIETWWKPYGGFEKTTLTESDRRVRAFLALDYAYSQENDRLELRISNREDTVYFMLRLHDGEVCSTSGGTAFELEKGFWLISAEEDVVRIEVTAD